MDFLKESGYVFSFLIMASLVVFVSCTIKSLKDHLVSQLAILGVISSCVFGFSLTEANIDYFREYERILHPSFNGGLIALSVVTFVYVVVRLIAYAIQKGHL